MTSVKIKFRKSTIKDKEGVLYFQLIHSRKTKLITTRFRLFPCEWDTHLESVVADKSSSERGLYLKTLKDGLEKEIRQIYELISVLENRGEYTIEELVEHYVNNSFDGYFFSFIKCQIKRLKSENRIKTASICETAYRSFSRFRRGEDIWIKKIDNVLINKYEAYLINNNVCRNTVSCYMRSLRSIYNQAMRKGVAVSNNPFRDVYTGVDKTSKKAVNESVILELCKLELSKQVNLEIARDIFMFSFYTRGMSFIDMANLRQSNLKNGYIIYSRSKTKQVLSIKIEKCIEKIIERYRYLTIDNYILPIYNKKNCNYISLLRTYNKRLKRLSEMMELEKPLSSYVARHSWATIAFRKGISVQVISEGMGHEDEKTTRIYLASMDQSIIDNANAQVIAL